MFAKLAKQICFATDDDLSFQSIQGSRVLKHLSKINVKFIQNDFARECRNYFEKPSNIKYSINANELRFGYLHI